MIYDDENEDEEDVKIEGDKSGNSGMIDLSTTTVQQQEEDSSNHPVWKMKLLGHSPIIKQYAIYNVCYQELKHCGVSLRTTVGASHDSIFYLIWPLFLPLFPFLISFSSLPKPLFPVHLSSFA